MGLSLRDKTWFDCGWNDTIHGIDDLARRAPADVPAYLERLDDAARVQGKIRDEYCRGVVGCINRYRRTAVVPSARGVKPGQY